VSEPEVDSERALLHAAETIARLGNLSEFEFLHHEVEEKQERMKAALSSRMMSGESVATLQRQVDYDRGFVDGMLYPFKVVRGAADKLRQLDEERESSEPEETTDMWRNYG
jgi:hypothetical protein